MAKNYFSDYPERIQDIFKYSSIKDLVLPLEEAFGESGFYKSAEEGLEFYQGALEEVGKFCALEVAPSAAAIDVEGVKFEDGEVKWPEKVLSHLNRCAELGVFSSVVSRKYDGLNMPHSTLALMMEMFAQACPNTALTATSFCMARFVEEWGNEEQKRQYIPKIVSAEWKTAMALTEAEAGSDLGKLRTTAIRDGDRYFVNGTKQFITNGNAELVFALVRTDSNSKGLKGLSVLVIPGTFEGKKNVKVTKIEHKVCLHASPTCEIVFDNSVGYLVGPENEGFKVMADLMNSARTLMGALAVGICVGAMEAAKGYARERVTMGQPIIKHPMIADMIYEMDVEIRAMRAMVLEAANAFDHMMIARRKEDKEAYKKWKIRYRRLTPLCKYMTAERSIYFARNALQIFGGYGVCQEYPVERILRETLIYPIYEGTSQIQSLMVLKDMLKDVPTNAAGFLGSLAGAWAESKVSRDPIKSYLLQARNELNQAIKTILLSILKEKFKADIGSLKEQKIQEFLRDFSLNLVTRKSDLSYPFLCAERFTRITCDYYALKCMVDHHVPGDKERAKWILAFAEIAVGRMRYENQVMIDRLPATLDYIKAVAPES